MKSQDEGEAGLVAGLIAHGHRHARALLDEADLARLVREQARPGDLVIVCGKGHEQSMCFGAVEHPWRDQDALRWALDRLLHRAETAPPFVLPTWQE